LKGGVRLKEEKLEIYQSKNKMGLFNNKEKESEEEEEKVETYEYKFECENCGNEKLFDIPKGTTIKTFLKDKECEVCNCLLIEKNKFSVENPLGDLV